MDITKIIAIDVHTYAHISHHVSEVPGEPEVRDAARRYFKQEGSSPTLPEIAAYYRERKKACVVFPVDAESATGEVRVSEAFLSCGKIPVYSLHLFRKLFYV